MTEFLHFDFIYSQFPQRCSIVIWPDCSFFFHPSDHTQLKNFNWRSQWSMNWQNSTSRWGCGKTSKLSAKEYQAKRMGQMSNKMLEVTNALCAAFWFDWTRKRWFSDITAALPLFLLLHKTHFHCVFAWLMKTIWQTFYTWQNFPVMGSCSFMAIPV